MSKECKDWEKLLPGAVIVEPGCSERTETGSWRYARPIYENKVPPCNYECAAGVDVQKFLDLAKQGRFEEACKVIKESNPFPSVCGRVCYHPCEEECNRGEFDEPLAVHNVERFVGDYRLRKDLAAVEMNIRKQRSPFKVAIVGSGPAGLSCAYHLARLGHQVTVFEALPVVGGMLAVGIPSYRLPKDVVKREVECIKAHGVEIRTNTRIKNLEELQGYDAVFLATGATKSIKLGIPGEDAVGVYHGIDFLKAVNFGEKVEIGKRVVVIGGGNTAIDCARTILRTGSSVTLLYRRSRDEMPATSEEVEEALAEGVKMQFLTAPKTVVTNQGKVVGIECLKMSLGEPDASGRRRPIPIKGSEFKLEVDTIIAAVGQRSDLSYLAENLELRNDYILIDEMGQTSRPGVFAGGDAAAGVPQRVVNAIGSGNRAAIAIDRYLRGESLPSRESPHVVKYGELNLEYFTPAPRIVMPHLPLAKRVKNFEEVNKGYTKEMSISEADRCFSCGVCNSCDNCWLFCPDMAVHKLSDKKYEIDLDHCKGCGICINECPRAAMRMIEEGEVEASNNRK